MKMPKIGDRIVVTAWAVREEVQCSKNEFTLDDLRHGRAQIQPEEVGLIWVPWTVRSPIRGTLAPTSIVCVCVGWVRKGEGVLHTKVEEQHKRFTATSWLRFPRVVLKANGPIRLAYTWRAFK